jgi:hypothetical protein
MNCFHCGAQIEVQERVGFRDSCPKCDRPAHACRNCEHYDPAYHNQCRETQAERVVEKDRANFCEYFAARKGAAPTATTVDARAKLDILFKRKT